ncbi:MAG TPA: peptide ABC transporter substrate-binding protein [Candidatus Limnocylindrales bacterium]|nr:peptide ABC transporter substrate-binding protein [Candidatus Limnocylindrales bacterium]
MVRVLTFSRRGSRAAWLLVATAVASAGLFVPPVVAPAGLAAPGVVSAAGKDEVRIVGGEPTTIDPAAQGDVGSAAVSAQLFESLTAMDPGLNVRPALAASWDLADGGRRIVFHLRDGLQFSDGSPLRAADVVRSWLRLIDRKSPSPLASLMLDVEGAADYLHGAGPSDDVGLEASGNDVVVRLVRPAADFPSIVAGPSFGVVPPNVERLRGAPNPAGFVGSGAYVLAAITPTEMTLRGNDRYWAGSPPIRTVHLIGDIGGRSAVDAFEADDIDYAAIPDFDASWIRYDAALGPQLREVPSLSLDYVGFDTSRPPFDDVRVRQAFGQAVDWRRIVTLGSANAVAATGMVPPGIPGGSATDFLPRHDPAAARALLAAAGYPGGKGFPDVTFVDPGSAYARSIPADIERELGITLKIESLDFDAFFRRLSEDSPPMWVLSWVADYPGANDFLGVLLGSGQANNYGRWSSPEFDAAIAAAGSAKDEAAATAAYDSAQTIVQRDVPAVPLSNGPGWALSRTGLLGAGQNGLGILRLASLAWADK